MGNKVVLGRCWVKESFFFFKKRCEYDYVLKRKRYLRDVKDIRKKMIDRERIMEKWEERGFKV